MENAIHKQSGKIVSAYKILKSLEWIGKEREEFIAPYHEIGNWKELNDKNIKEVRVSFVKRHKRQLENGEIILVQSHFRIETEGAIENPNNESEEHKLAKENIYDRAIDDALIVDGKKLSEIGEIEDIRIECQSGKKRADVLIKFKDFHSIYGIGIAFEIQISPQKIEKTEERNYDRASYGYSIIWLWNGELDKKDFRVVPYSEAIKDYHKQLKLQSEKMFWDIDERTNNKIQEIIESIEKKLFHQRMERDLLDIKIQDDLKLLEKLDSDIMTKIEFRAKNQNEIIEEELKKIIVPETREIIKEGKLNEIIIKYIQDYVFQTLITKEEMITYHFGKILNDKINEIIQKETNKNPDFAHELFLKSITLKPDEWFNNH